MCICLLALLHPSRAPTAAAAAAAATDLATRHSSPLRLSPKPAPNDAHTVFIRLARPSRGAHLAAVLVVRGHQPAGLRLAVAAGQLTRRALDGGVHAVQLRGHGRQEACLCRLPRRPLPVRGRPRRRFPQRRVLPVHLAPHGFELGCLPPVAAGGVGDFCCGHEALL